MFFKAYQITYRGKILQFYNYVKKPFLQKNLFKSNENLYSSDWDQKHS